MPYIPNTDEDRRTLLKEIGCQTIGEMWEKAGISCSAPELNEFPCGRSEFEVTRHLQSLADLNSTHLVNFLGCGYYDHFIPAAVAAVTGKPEFYTAYTPYQPEASQGTLQAIYEYQSAICRLTDMEVSNASLYDGGTALFEAMMMAVRVTRRRQVIISGAVSPIYRMMIRCYCLNLNVELVEVPPGASDSAQQRLTDQVTEQTACVLVQYPNVFGVVEDWTETVERIHEKKALAISSSYPLALAMIKSPGEMGFDVVTGEGQSLGIPLSFGGPYLGYMAVKEKLMRKMPGRICGKTLDLDGKEGFVLTLQTREQHIRRANAMSNICSNENLCALTALAYLTCVGKQGLKDVARLCSAKAVYARRLLAEIDGVTPLSEDPFFNEFVIQLPGDASDVIQKMIDKGFAAGFPLGRYYPERMNQLLVSVTEKRTREEIKSFATALEAALWN